MRNLLPILLASQMFGCTPSGIQIDDDVYRFPAWDPEENAVANSGQIMRQLLINDLYIHIGGLTERLDDSFTPASGDVEDELNFYYDFDDSVAGDLPPLYSADLPLLQATYNDVSTGKDLDAKIAGNDNTTDHKDWSTEFTGWEASGVTSPESLIRHWIDQIDTQAVDWASGTYPLDPAGDPVDTVYLTDDGLDLRHLIDKFLRGAICLSQGGDDYLDNDTPDKGLFSDHTDASEDKPYSTLEHAWDEGFGYFGASVHYGEWSDAAIQNKARDDNDDGLIDLTSEVSSGASINGAKIDQSSVTETDFTAEAWHGFHAGRALLATTDGDLSSDELDELIGYRDEALAAWEGAIAATAVHYINVVLRDIDSFDASYDYASHAKHYSELKGYALGFQFNPHSPLTDSQFAELHSYLGQRPVMPTASSAEIDASKTNLRAAKALLGSAYGFDAANLGDDNGENGW